MFHLATRSRRFGSRIDLYALRHSCRRRQCAIGRACTHIARVFPYEPELLSDLPLPRFCSTRISGRAARILRKRRCSERTMVERGLSLVRIQDVYPAKLVRPLRSPSLSSRRTITSSSTGGKVFNRIAPVIKLPAEAHRGRSSWPARPAQPSSACFWMKQVCHQQRGRSRRPTREQGSARRLGKNSIELLVRV